MNSALGSRPDVPDRVLDVHYGGNVAPDSTDIVVTLDEGRSQENARDMLLRMFVPERHAVVNFQYLSFNEIACMFTSNDGNHRSTTHGLFS